MGGSQWLETTIGEQVTLQRGFDITRVEQNLGDVPVVSSSGIHSYHDTAAVKGPGVVLGRKGVVGSVYYVASDYWPHDTTLWVKDFHGNNQRFVYYFFKAFAPQLANMDVGSANPTLNRNHVHPLTIHWPPLPEQRAIAHILGTLDDKIELNRRMNQTLEDIARALFKSWFVDFDPVRAKRRGEPACSPSGLAPHIANLFPDEFVDSELGEIPKGWKVSTLGQIIEIHDSKRIPLSSRERSKRQGIYPYYGAAGIIDYVDDYLFDGIYVLIGEDGSVVTEQGNPVVQYVWGKFWVSNHAHVLTGATGVSNEHLMLLLKQIYLLPYVTGAVQPKLSQTNMKAIPIIQAPIVLNKVFGQFIAPLFTKSRLLYEQNITLAALRDTLLPKLISGELRVPDAERIIGRCV